MVTYLEVVLIFEGHWPLVFAIIGMTVINIAIYKVAIFIQFPKCRFALTLFTIGK